MTPNQDTRERRTDFELQDTYVASEQLRLVGGFGARHQSGESQTFLGGTRSSTLQWLFGNVEYRPAAWLTLNGGGYAEHNTLAGSTFSPRAAVNLRVSSSQTVRLVWSKGTRSPDIQEQRANWTYAVDDLDPPLNGSRTGRLYQSAVALGGLVSERIASRELGYLLNVQRLGLLMDVKLFRDDLTSLISERLNLAGFAPTNDNSVSLRGAELQLTIEWSPRWSGFLNYAYLDNSDATHLLERSQYSRHSGSIGLTHAFGRAWRGSLAYYGSSGDGVGESGYGRWDLMLSTSTDVQGLPWTTSISVRRLDKRSATYTFGASDPLASTYSGKVQVYGQISVRFP